MSIAGRGYPLSRMRLGFHAAAAAPSAPIGEMATAITTAVDLLTREGRLPACIAEWSEFELAEARRAMEAGGKEDGRTHDMLGAVLGALGACRAGKEAKIGS